MGILSQKQFQIIKATYTWEVRADFSYVSQWTPTSSFPLTLYNLTVEFPRWTRFRYGFLTKWILFNIFFNIFCRINTLQISAKITTRPCGRLNVKDIAKRLTVTMRKGKENEKLRLKKTQKMEIQKACT